jgi:uncharacterized protein (TIGR02145 family)
MKHLLTFFACLFAVSLSAQTVDLPYNPDSNADQYISTPDLLDFLPNFDSPFEVGELMVDGMTLEQYLSELSDGVTVVGVELVSDTVLTFTFSNDSVIAIPFPEAIIGPQGLQGPPGPQGDPGATGDVGPQGDTGDDGANGSDGATGPTGLTGETGAAGTNGFDGATGLTGSTGSDGASAYEVWLSLGNTGSEQDFIDALSVEANLPTLVGCADAAACNFNSVATANYPALCLYVDACGVCDGPGATYNCGCVVQPAEDCDCDGNQLDALNVCGGTCTADADNDGLCDDGDDCIGAADACGVCNGPGAIYSCGCTSMPAEDCDCDGNQLDALGVCGGTCTADADNDGICDDNGEDPCVGTYDNCAVCNGPGDIYDCGCNEIPAEDCDCDGNQLDALNICGGTCTADADNDGFCDDQDPCIGGYDAIGICNGSCVQDFDADGICDDVDDCVGAYDAINVCGGNCAEDADNDGVCDVNCAGTLDACGICDGPGQSVPLIDQITILYDSVYASVIDDWVVFEVGTDTTYNYICPNNCPSDIDGDGVCDADEIGGCPEASACNFDALATDDNGSCQFPVDLHGFDYVDCAGDCLSDLDGDGLCSEADLCEDSTACNFNDPANGPCLTLDNCGVCGGPDPYVPEITSITILYDSIYAEVISEWVVFESGADTLFYYTCFNGCLSDVDGDGVCDTDEIPGCQDDTYCNFDPAATDSDPSICAGLPDECGVCEGPGGPCPFVDCGDEMEFDGYDYATVEIGTQCWFSENLRSEHYLNGDLIPSGLSDFQWSNTSAGAQAYHSNSASNLATYGRLYNWYAVDDARGLCPSGWHVPSDDEWKTMEMHLGMSASDANSTSWRSSGSVGGKLKEAGTAHWNSPNTGANNSSGFTGLGHGLRSSSGGFSNLLSYGAFWSSSPSGGDAWTRALDSNFADVYRNNYATQRYGFAVRCVGD